MNEARFVNVFGALTILASDEIRAGAQREVEHGGATSAALNIIGHQPGMSIDSLAHSLELSHPGAVRLVDRLVLDGLVERRISTSDRRSATLFITRAGVRLRRRVLGARSASILSILEALSSRERQQLDVISAKLLAANINTEIQALAVCRFCDEGACDPCPLATLER